MQHLPDTLILLTFALTALTRSSIAETVSWEMVRNVVLLFLLDHM